MNFINPETISYTEISCVVSHSQEIASYGNKALIVTGRYSAKKSGALDDILTALEKHNTAYIIFDQVEENPSVETVLMAAELGIKESTDFVIGIGGGSPLDAAKAISIMIKNPDKEYDYLFTPGDYDSLPVICIPTTCGTGSEATGVSVLTRHDLKTKVSMKKKLFPVLSLIDPSYLKSLSTSGIRNTSIDAMGHMIESFVNANATSQSKDYVLAGLNLWSKVKNYLSEEDHSDRPDIFWENLARSSNLGGYSIVQPGTSMPHALSYKLTYEYHVPHGMAIGIYEPVFLSMAGEEDRHILMKAMGFDSFKAFTDFINTNCFVPLLRDYITKEALIEITKQALDIFLADAARMSKLTFELNKELFFKYFEV